MEISLLAMDLDGTALLDDHKSFTPRLYAALSAAAQKGVAIVPTTGRQYAMLPPAIHTGADWEDLCVLCNGSEVRRLRTGELLEAHYIEADAAVQMIEIAARMGLSVELSAGGLLYLTQESWDMQREHEDALCFHLNNILTTRGRTVSALEEVLNQPDLALDKVNLVGGCTHASTYKAISMLGMGRKSLTAIPCYPGRESVNLELLEEYLQKKKGEPVVVIANLGTANSGDYDDMAAIARLKDKYGFYLHVDASIIGIAACSDKYAHIFEGLEKADSISVDAHKWLNTTYDAAVQLTRHPDLQYQAFAQTAGEPGPMPASSPLFNFTPEGSRRFRALPLWFSLMAYGRKGYRELVERNCALTQELGAKMAATPYFRLMNDVRLNIICYTLKVDKPDAALINEFVTRLRDKGVTYSNTTVYDGVPSIRICLSNYLTTQKDVDAAYASILETAREMFPGRE